jgi:enoyl-CoA hydratase/carnithine racemase
MLDQQPNLLVKKYEGCEGLFIIALNRADLRNTLSIETIIQLTKTFAELSQETEISVIVLHGLGEAFAAGADIKELLKLTPQNAVEFSELGGKLFSTIVNSPQLIIAAVDGYCMGGGLDLALSCDLRYGSHKAIFAHPGANIGIITGFGGTYRLPNLVGLKKASQLFATAERINAKQALEIGLIQAIAENKSAYELAIEKGSIIAKLRKPFISHLKKSLLIANNLQNKQATLLLNYFNKLNY